MPPKKKFKRVMLDMESGHKQTLTVEGNFKIHDVLMDVDTPGSWVVIPTATGGHFCTRSGLVLAISVEDAEVPGVRTT